MLKIKNCSAKVEKLFVYAMSGGKVKINVISKKEGNTEGNGFSWMGKFIWVE